MDKNLKMRIAFLVFFAFCPVLSFAKSDKKDIHNHPLEIKSDWQNLGVNLAALEAVANKYFEQPYRYNYDAPEYSVKKIEEVYFKVFKSHLPEIVVTQMKQNLTDYQNGAGKQKGFTNEHGLASVLPKKGAPPQEVISSQAGI